jgi:hypothetical protein
MRRSLLPFLPFAMASAALALEPPGTALPFDRSAGGLPVVTVVLAGQPFRFGIDTGTSRSMIAAALAERLGLPVAARFPIVTPDGGERLGLCSGPLRMDLAGIDLFLDCLGWVPGERALAGAPDLDGLLAADALGAIDLWIEPRRGRARVARAGELGVWVDGVPLAVERIEGRPAIGVRLSGGDAAPEERLVVDSGSDATLLFGEAARRAADRHRSRLVGARLETAAGSVETVAAPLGRARAGGRAIDPGWALLLEGRRDRTEAGLLPLAALGPTLFELANGRLVAGARLRDRPRPAGHFERSSIAAIAPK